MEFGRVDENLLDEVDFSLPAEPANNRKVLFGTPAKQSKVYLGCAKWGRPEWLGKIYPLKTKEKNFYLPWKFLYASKRRLPFFCC